MTGLTRRKAAELIAQYFQTGYVQSVGSSYHIRDPSNRIWKTTYDGSIRKVNERGRSVNNENYSVELVSPICKYEDIETIQKIVRKLRKEGHAKVNSSCGIHIHIDGNPHNARTIRNISNIMYSKEDLIYKALQVQSQREYNYCKKMEEDYVDSLNKSKPKSLDRLETIWYLGNSNQTRRYATRHYDGSRYHALNLHALFEKGTIEFRMFNGTLHAGEIKSYIQFCLAISHQALIQKRASRMKTHSTNEKYTFRTWLLRLGMIGDEFKTARHHLLKHLDGCIAWKDPAQAEAQKERLRAKREAQQLEESVQEVVNDQMQMM